MNEEKYRAEARHFERARQDAPAEDTAAGDTEVTVPSSRLKQAMRRQVRKPAGGNVRLRANKPKLRLQSPKRRLQYTGAEAAETSVHAEEDMARPGNAARSRSEGGRPGALKTAQRRRRLRLPARTAPEQHADFGDASGDISDTGAKKRRLHIDRPVSGSENAEAPEGTIWRYQYRQLRFRTASEHWRFGDRQETRRAFRFSDSGKKPPSKLKFEEDRASHASRLKFEEDKVAHKKGVRHGDSLVRREVDRSLDELADQSENEGIQAGNQHRKWQAAGLSRGWRAGGTWRRGHDERAMRREIKRATRAEKDAAYELRHGKPSRSAELRKKLMIRKRQMESFAEKKVGKKAVQNTERFIAFVVEKAAQLIRLAVAYVAGPAVGVLVVYAAVAVLVLIMFSAFMDSATAMVSAYTAEDTEIEAVSSYYTQLEAKLDKQIKDIPSAWEWQHIDEFHYDLDDIEHDPFQLMAYLSVKYPGFTFADVKTELDYIFDQRYTLTLDEWTETCGDPPDTYIYYHLDVTLRARPMEPILMQELAKDTENDLVSWYDVLMETRGAHQAYANPFDIDWSDSVSSLYGYRVDPIGGRELQQHRGLDISMPTGTPIRAGLTGTVRYVGVDSIMGNYIIIDADDADHTMKYGHCNEVEASAGDKVVAGETVIGTVGSSGQSTGPHLHVEILENGEYLDPVYSLKYEAAEGD